MINVVQTGNANVYKGICLTALSIMKYTKEPVHYHLMSAQVSWDKTSKITEEQADKLREVLKSYNEENELTYYDVSKDLEETFYNTPNMKPKYTPATLIRLFMDKYLDVDKLIYLDADIMTTASLEEFNKIDIDDKEMAVCLDYMGRFWIKRDYFNAGVLYVNLNECKKNNVFENCIELLKKKKYYFADQTALYKTLTKKVYIPFRFNEQRDIKEDTVVKHFCKGIRYLPFFKVYNVKQWDVKNVHGFLKMNNFDDIYKLYDEVFKDYDKLSY